MLACLHILGVAADWLLTREDLVRAMITGRKMLDEKSAAAEHRPVSGWRALVVTALVAIAGFALFHQTDFAELATAPAKTGQRAKCRDLELGRRVSSSPVGTRR